MMRIDPLQQIYCTLPALEDVPSSPLTLTVHRLDTVDSTNQTLWQLVEQGALPGAVAIARQQQAGRGQRGRQWQSLPGGLYLSLFLAPNLAAAQASQLTFSFAWGIAAALRHQAVPVWLKWPNDLLVEGRKLGGILVETRVRQGEIAEAVVGIGMNWSNPVPPTGIALQSLLAQSASAAIPNLNTLGAIVLQGALTGFQLLQQQGIESILSHYESLLANRGQDVMTPQGAGTVVGVRESGRLRVRLLNSPHPQEIDLAPGEIQLGYSSFAPLG